MRRFKQQLNNNDIKDILNRCSSGTLALFDTPYPYQVPLSYAFYSNCIYFHTALEGYKLDLIEKNNHASFSIIELDQVIEEEFTTLYRSAIVRGKVNIIENEKEKEEAIELIAKKYSPSTSSATKESFIKKYFDNFKILRLNIEEMTGKASKRLIK